MHENHACDSCHFPADGTARQQVQANLQYWLGFRSSSVDFLTKTITNNDCLDCHRNKLDPHAEHLMMELRFSEVRDLIAPHRCGSCHDHHSGLNLTVPGNFCSHCHADVSLEVEVANPSHVELVEGGRWETCLQCHDFHKNHLQQTPRDLDSAHALDAVQDYFDGVSPAPYGEIRTSYLDERGTPR